MTAIANESPTTRHRQGVAQSSGVPKSVLPPYKMPPVRVGQTVMWFPDRFAGEGAVAFVTVTGESCISLSMIVAGAIQVLPRESVHHRNDPNKEMLDNLCNAENPCGVWDYVQDGRNDYLPEGEVVGLLVSRVDSVEKRLADLENAVTSK